LNEDIDVLECELFEEEETWLEGDRLEPTDVDSCVLPFLAQLKRVPDVAADATE
jgi:hypothetical protein